MMYYEKYGNELNPIIMCLHGANLVQSFSKQCDYLSRNYCVIVPHLPGYGRNCDAEFSTPLAIEQLTELAASFNKQVTLVGFSLGAQLCLPLICEHGDLFNGAVMISPWLIKDTAEVEKVMKQQADSEKMAKNKLLLGINGLVLGLDKNERSEYEEYSKNVSMNTILASIDNGIELKNYPDFVHVVKPMTAICGIKEITDIRKSVRTLSMQNPKCTYDMWDGAAHNIPFKYASRLNKTIEDFVDKIYTKD
ncbi:MAG: alpha/beta hydrolase [Oscillospiraceae bacterium]|nr:alpha/beta hydrolase [Oscillospiraceae bacterium]